MADRTLDYAGPPRDPRGEDSVARGHVLGRYSALCIPIMIPCVILPLLVVLPVAFGFGFGLAAVVKARGRSGLGWFGLTVHGGIVCSVVLVLLLH